MLHGMVKIKLGVLLIKMNPRNESALEHIHIYIHLQPLSQSATDCKTVRKGKAEAPMASPRHIQVVAVLWARGLPVTYQHQYSAHSDDIFIAEALLTYPRLQNAVYDP